MKMKNVKKMSFLLVIIMIISLLVGSLAYFTDRQDTNVSTTAGTVSINLDYSGINLLDKDGKDILNPGDGRTFNYTVTNLGNKSVYVLETIILSAYDKEGNPLDLNGNPSEFEIYNANDVYETEGDGWMVNDGAQPIEVRVLNENTVTYTRPSYVLSGSTTYEDNEREIEIINGQEISDVSLNEFMLLFNLWSSNRMQGCSLLVDVVVEAKQYRNTGAIEWAELQTETLIISNGNEVEVVPKYDITDTNIYTYNIGETTTITGLTSIGKDMTVLNVPDSLEGVIVTVIDDNAFSDSSAKLITIPDTVEEIGTGVFSDSTSLESVIFNNSITHIPDNSFDGCTSLGVVILDDSQSVITVGQNAFGDSYYVFEDTDGDGNINKIVILGSLDGKIPVDDDGDGIVDRLVDATDDDGDGIYVDTEGNEYVDNNGDGIYEPYIAIFTYVPKSDNPEVLEITGLTEYGATLTSWAIPETIQGKAVNSIAANAFKGNSVVQEVSVPATIKNVGNYAFQDCTALTTLDYNAATGGTWQTFRGCTKLETIDIDGLVNPAYGMFYNCDSLDTIIWGDDITSISDNMFYDCNSLQEITISKTVKSIGTAAFSYCSNLTTVNFEDGVTSIKTSAFYKTKIQTLSLPNTLTSIGSKAFEECDNLTNIEFNAKLKTIGDNAFYDCDMLGPVVFPSSLTKIGTTAFYSCDKLTSATFNEGLTTIGDRAFCESGLTSVAIPSTVTSIGLNPFSSCSKLESITVNENNKTYNSNNNCNAIIKTSTKEVISGCMNTIIPDGTLIIGQNAFNSCSGITSIIIPDSVTTIKSYAFYNCNNANFTSVKLSANLTTIENNAFDNNKYITEITIPSTVTSIGSNAFRSCDRLTTIYYSGSATGAPWGATNATIVAN